MTPQWNFQIGARLSTLRLWLDLESGGEDMHCATVATGCARGCARHAT